jgi:hypothetical protein
VANLFLPSQQVSSLNKTHFVGHHHWSWMAYKHFWTTTKRDWSLQQGRICIHMYYVYTYTMENKIEFCCVGSRLPSSCIRFTATIDYSVFPRSKIRRRKRRDWSEVKRNLTREARKKGRQFIYVLWVSSGQ